MILSQIVVSPACQDGPTGYQDSRQHGHRKTQETPEKFQGGQDGPLSTGPPTIHQM